MRTPSREVPEYAAGDAYRIGHSIIGSNPRLQCYPALLRTSLTYDIKADTPFARILAESCDLTAHNVPHLTALLVHRSKFLASLSVERKQFRL